MLLSLVQSLFPSSSSSSSPSTFQSKTHASIFQTLANPTSSSSSPLLPKSLFPDLDSGHALNRLLHVTRRSSSTRARRFAAANAVIQASLLESPVLWAGRVCVFYALLKIGLAGSKANPLVSELDGEEESGSGGGSGAGIAGAGDLGFSKWIESIQGNPDKEASDKRKLVSKWHPTTKGTLRRNYRVPSKSEGRRLLKSVAALLSEDDHFTDATSHKGCQIRRESAHGESVCCNNVRALFDELPTPHLVVEITPFPVGSLTEKDYLKAEKLERVLRSGPSV